MEAGPGEESGWERVLDLSLVVAELAVAVPCVPLMAAVGLIETMTEATLPPRPDPRLAPGIVRARALLERERLRHSVLSESFLTLTRLEEQLDEELSGVATVPGHTPVDN